MPGRKQLPACILLPSRASLYGSAPWAAGSYLEESWLWLRRVESMCKSFGVGPIKCQCECGPLFLLNTSVLHQSLPQRFYFLWSLILLLPTLCQAERTWQISLPGTQEHYVSCFGCDFLSLVLSFTPTCPHWHSGSRLYCWSDFRVSLNFLLDFAVKSRLIYHLLLHCSLSGSCFFSFL